MNPLHYPDLERCKKLTEIGFPQGMGMTWYTATRKKTGEKKEWISDMNRIDSRSWKYGAWYVCPSIAEFLDVIPKEINGHSILRVFYIENRVDVGYDGEWYTIVDTLPNALCDLIFWLVEQGHLKFTDNPHLLTQ